MSKRLDVLKALKVLIAVAVPQAEVLGLDGEEAAPGRVRPGGRIIVRTGDPGDPEIDLSPLAYNWTHRIAVEIVMPERPSLTPEEVLDAALGKIGAAIEADRHLGGLCDWIDVVAPATDNVWIDGAEALQGADLMIVATYVTASPLS